MSIILGLDVSTSVTGICIVDSDIVPDDLGSHILKLEAIELSKFKTIWEKADIVKKYFEEFEATNEYKIDKIDRIVLEEALTAFRPGMSSAATISTLIRFNGIVSYMARNIFDKEPEYIGSAHARKLCGIKLQRTATGGPQKEQVFSYMENNDLKHVMWPLKKSGKVVEWSRDATDAYVIARAASVNGPVLPPVKKPKKPKPKT